MGSNQRVDLDHAEREATSLKRYGDVNGFEDLAEFAALTLALATELRDARVTIRGMRRFVERGHSEGHSDDYWQDLSIACGSLRTYDQATGRPDPAAGHADPEGPS